MSTKAELKAQLKALIPTIVEEFNQLPHEIEGNNLYLEIGNEWTLEGCYELRGRHVYEPRTYDYPGDEYWTNITGEVGDDLRACHYDEGTGEETILEYEELKELVEALEDELNSIYEL